MMNPMLGRELNQYNSKTNAVGAIFTNPTI